MANSNMLSKLAISTHRRGNGASVPTIDWGGPAPLSGREGSRHRPLNTEPAPRFHRSSEKDRRAEFWIVAASAHATNIGLHEIIALEEQGFA